MFAQYVWKEYIWQIFDAIPLHLLIFDNKRDMLTCLDFQFEPALLAIILGTRST